MKTKKLTLSFLFLITTLFIFQSSVFAAQKCYGVLGCYDVPISRSDGLLNATQNDLDEFIKYIQKAYDRGEIKLDNEGKFTGSVQTAATGHYGVINVVKNVVTSYTCNNGWGITYTYEPGCSNGATNPTACNICPSGSNMINGQCTCNNGATGSQCNICPAGQTMYNNLCVCTNGATNPTACNICPAGANMINNQCVCTNGGDPFTSCSSCKPGDVMDNNTGQCGKGCDTTNVCGQTITGIMVNGVCSSTVNGKDPNSSCISVFNTSTDNVNPNGSVEFSWKLADTPGISSRCGFVDLTTPTPRPIPGLQNLNPTVDRARITNIQVTTRFCLICQFYNLIDNRDLGDAVVHQWIRVIKIGEN